MKVDFGRKLKDLDGKEVEVLLKDVATNALVFTYKDEENVGTEVKTKRWKLAKTIKQSVEPLDLVDEDVTMVRDLICKAYAVKVSGPACDAIEE